MDITKSISSWFWKLKIINENSNWSWNAYYGDIKLCSLNPFNSKKEAIDNWSYIAKKQCFCWDQESIPEVVSDQIPKN